MITTIDSMVEETASRLLAEHAEPAVVEAAEQGKFPDKLWAAIAAAGLTTALDEGLEGLPAALAVAKACGAVPAPAPVVETLLARGLARAAGLALPEGISTIAPPRASELRIVRDGAGARLRGSIGGVPFGRYAASVAVPIEGQLALVPTKGIKWTKAKAYSGDACDAAELDVTVPAVGKLPLSADALGALMRSFQMAGAMKAVLAMTLQYANDRVQFGRPLGKFQALQHMLAEMAENAAAAETAANNALRAWGSPSERLMLAAAKIRCGEAAGIVAAGAHQLHGAIGFTREHRLHHYTRRLYTWRDEFGHEGDWAIELGRAALARGPEQLWPLITDS